MRLLYECTSGCVSVFSGKALRSDGSTCGFFRSSGARRCVFSCLVGLGQAGLELRVGSGGGLCVCDAFGTGGLKRGRERRSLCGSCSDVLPQAFRRLGWRARGVG